MNEKIERDLVEQKLKIAFEKGDYYRLNKLIKEGLNSDSKEVRELALTYKNKIKIDLATILVFIITLLTLILVVYLYVI